MGSYASSTVSNHRVSASLVYRSTAFSDAGLLVNQLVFHTASLPLRTTRPISLRSLACSLSGGRGEAEGASASRLEGARARPPARNSGCDEKSPHVPICKCQVAKRLGHAARCRRPRLAHRASARRRRWPSPFWVRAHAVSVAPYPLGPLRLLRGLVGAERLERHVKVAHVQAAAAARPRWSRK